MNVNSFVFRSLHRRWSFTLWILDLGPSILRVQVRERSHSKRGKRDGKSEIGGILYVYPLKVAPRFFRRKSLRGRLGTNPDRSPLNLLLLSPLNRFERRKRTYEKRNLVPQGKQRYTEVETSRLTPVLLVSPVSFLPMNSELICIIPKFPFLFPRTPRM